MVGEAITKVSGRAVVVPGADIDTDRIIPARFLRCVTFDGLGEQLFWDVRFEPDGTPKSHPLNEPTAEGARILISGRNFGCGSSREHAPQSIARAGFRAVVAESFAEIFFGNSLTLGLVCATATAEHLVEIGALVAGEKTVELTLDVEAGVLQGGGRTWPVGVPASARDALVAGQWDPLAQLRAGEATTRAVAGELAYLRWTRS
ncbi:MAG: 3-isopropylmalate dehydratase small subunit [Myxococcota bacterium]